MHPFQSHNARIIVMRTDIVIVDARLLGIWQLIAAVYAIAWIVAVWAGFAHMQPGQQEYYNLHFAVELVTGLYLLLKTEHLFHLLSPAGGKGEETEYAERQE